MRRFFGVAAVVVAGGGGAYARCAGGGSSARRTDHECAECGEHNLGAGDARVAGGDMH